MKKIYVSLVSFAFMFNGCGNNESDNNNSNNNETVNKSSKIISQSIISKKDYSLKIVDGETIKASREGTTFKFDVKQKLVLLDFFTTWCPACRSVAPHLSNLGNKYKNDLAIIGILVENSRSDDNVREFKNKYGAKYDIANSTNESDDSNFKLSNDIASLLKMARSYPIPLLVLLKDGEYYRHYIGAVPEEMIESDLLDALGKRE
jgi:thiol-disulfide isomerase/thioredoxin